MSPPSERVKYLRSLKAVRQQSLQVFQRAQSNQLCYWTLHEEHEEDVVARCASLLKRDYGLAFHAIPPHGRWRHINANNEDRIGWLLAKWSHDGVPIKEQGRRLVEFFILAVLLDAGAGHQWTYKEATWDGGPRNSLDACYNRSEGLAVAVFHMYRQGVFSSDGALQPYKVDAEVLSSLATADLANGFQCNSPDNPMLGLEGRTTLLQRLGKCVQRNKYGYFTARIGDEEKEPRLGCLLDHILSLGVNRNDSVEVDMEFVWSALLEALSEIWPDDRITLNNCPLGDVWPSKGLLENMTMSEEDELVDSLVPFHKLSQWLAYSLLEILEKVLGLTVKNATLLTGLPEYRNGGLFIDLKVLQPRQELYEASKNARKQGVLRFNAKHPAIVEWRALTVILLDRVHSGLLKALNVSETEFSLPQMLEACTWKAGREVAKEKRPDSGAPPIEIESDGTIF